mmetsp:Transcript_2389/g.5683  ORF Transcript_2389/g.5683 Transcript_2389/m.5683 type:complete len:243 (-) Transcript_2389:959-1687(-)
MAVLQCLVNHAVVAGNLEHEVALLGVLDHDLGKVDSVLRGQRSACLLDLAEHGANASVGVLRVGRSVPVKLQHLVPGEDVVLDAVRRKVKVLDRADADDVSDASALLLTEGGVLLGHCSGSTSLGLVEEVEEAHSVAGASLERLLVLAHDSAERDVSGVRAVGEPSLLGHVEHLSEVVTLASIDYVQDAGGLEVLGAVADGSQVGGSVAKATVSLLDQEGHHAALALVEPWHVRDHGALALR